SVGAVEAGGTGALALEGDQAGWELAVEQLGIEEVVGELHLMSGLGGRRHAVKGRCFCNGHYTFWAIGLHHMSFSRIRPTTRRKISLRWVALSSGTCASSFCSSGIVTMNEVGVTEASTWAMAPTVAKCCAIRWATVARVSMYSPNTAVCCC